jgi:hypothetical protein
MAFKINALATARTLRAVCILASLTFFAPAHAEQNPAPPAPAAVPLSATTPATAPKLAQGTGAPVVAPSNKTEVKPTWVELTAGQQKVLAPLASQWSSFDVNHKTKWLAISEKYEKMSPEQQQRLEKNISDWARMTPEQHRQAREGYARAKKLDTEQKTALLQQYQQLSDEQKQKLVDDANAKKHIANVPSLQSKPKIVEPLKQKKLVTNHNGTNHVASTTPSAAPAQGKVATPVASTPVVPASVAAQASTPAATPSPAPAAK